MNGKTLGENIEGAQIYNDDVIRTRSKPLSESGGLAVLRGNLAPDGAVIKAAADRRSLKHTGPAVVFKDYNDMSARIDRDDLDVRRELGAGAAATPGRSAARACRSGACCRCRRSC